MATVQTGPGEVIDLINGDGEHPNHRTRVIVKTKEMELIRLVLPAGKEIAGHKVSGPFTLYCINGKIELTAMGATRALTPGQLLYLAPDEMHSLKAAEDSVILLTIIFK